MLGHTLIGCFFKLTCPETCSLSLLYNLCFSWVAGYAGLCSWGCEFEMAKAGVLLLKETPRQVCTQRMHSAN